MKDLKLFIGWGVARELSNCVNSADVVELVEHCPGVVGLAVDGCGIGATKAV